MQNAHVNEVAFELGWLSMIPVHTSGRSGGIGMRIIRMRGSPGLDAITAASDDTAKPWRGACAACMPVNGKLRLNKGQSVFSEWGSS